MRKLLVLPLLLLFLAACQADENDLIFNGTSQNWSAQLTVSVINGSENNELELTYQRNDLGTIKALIIMWKILIEELILEEITLA